MFADIK